MDVVGVYVQTCRYAARHYWLSWLSWQRQLFWFLALHAEENCRRRSVVTARSLAAQQVPVAGQCVAAGRRRHGGRTAGDERGGGCGTGCEEPLPLRSTAMRCFSLFVRLSSANCAAAALQVVLAIVLMQITGKRPGCRLGGGGNRLPLQLPPALRRYRRCSSLCFVFCRVALAPVGLV